MNRITEYVISFPGS